MSKGWGSQLICLRLLTLALAIQALTPDANDLCSSSLFKLLGVPFGKNLVTCAVATAQCNALDPESMPVGEGSFPSGANDQDDSPDEVCLPDGRHLGAMLSRRAGGSKRFTCIPCGSCREAALYRRGYATRCHTGNLISNNLHLSLSRMTC